MPTKLICLLIIWFKVHYCFTAHILIYSQTFADQISLEQKKVFLKKYIVCCPLPNWNLSPKLPTFFPLLSCSTLRNIGDFTE